MDVDPKVVAARRDAEFAKQRLLASAHLLQARVSPSRLANDALETAKERGNVAVDTITDAAKRRPGLFAAAGAGLLALIARRRIGRLFRRKKPPHELVATPHAKMALPRP